MLDLPMPSVILLHIIRGDMPAKMVIDVVYPLLLGIGAALSWFLGFHVKYILHGRTTLEHSIFLEEQIARVQGVSSNELPISKVKNPFDQGYWANMKQILGDSWLALVLPVFVAPPLPFVPKQDKCK